MTTAAHIAQGIREAKADLEELFERIDEAERHGREMESLSLERIANRLSTLIDEQERRLEAMESEAPRRAAEARLAHHMEHDALDLY